MLIFYSTYASRMKLLILGPTYETLAGAISLPIKHGIVNIVRYRYDTKMYYQINIYFRGKVYLLFSVYNDIASRLLLLIR